MEPSHSQDLRLNLKVAFSLSLCLLKADTMWPAASCSWCHGFPAMMHWTVKWGAKISPSSLTLFLAGYSVTVWEKHLIQRPTSHGKEACHPTDQLGQWVQLEKYLGGAKGLQRHWGTSKSFSGGDYRDWAPATGQRIAFLLSGLWQYVFFVAHHAHQCS